MLFNSYEFILFFLPITFFVYFFLNQRRLIVAGKVWLVLASLFFYSWWNPIYLPLILISMAINYVVGTRLSLSVEGMAHGQTMLGMNWLLSRKTMLVFGLAFNVGLLAYFKYLDFFIANFNGVFGADVPLQNVVLPLAISFFTFQQIAYLVDSYRKETQEYNVVNYMLFITFFPQLIAGPIVHHKEMMPQFASRWNLIKRYKNISLGAFIFSMGLFKKVVIADTFARWANSGFDSTVPLGFVEAWVTSLSYTFQLYFDFSGYTDMAIGAALLFNIKLPINFNSPYKAKSIQDFWRRWHITLSRFLRDYVYIPLGGNRGGRCRTYLNLFATFLVGGLWHGASWMFVIWGALHGAALVLHRLWNELGCRMHPLLGWFVTFMFINVTWVFFRAESLSDATKVLGGMVGGLSYVGLLNFKFVLPVYNFLLANIQLIFIFVAIFSVLALRNSSEYFQRGGVSFRRMVFSGLMFAFVFLLYFHESTSESQFLYFNF
ncbi:MBOAT family protein [Cellvibrio sp. PSBB006]|uniref:MBOAT family O-acyltransferase n=1 Tax=Cellvibrio sp. PSBB006 TaxID=1987723 RepID=UPI000B3B2F44|nr:MBOAT family O-acyltransferase [Cellvibrio sp. PSBB006]ARU26801.1 membrane-bound O-acyltransferase family protein [Cellvibrio sp. PSBB006]